MRATPAIERLERVQRALRGELLAASDGGRRRWDTDLRLDFGAWAARDLGALPGTAGWERRKARLRLRGGHLLLVLLDAVAGLRVSERREEELRGLEGLVAAARATHEGGTRSAAAPSLLELDLRAALGPRGFAPADLGQALAAAREESTLAIAASAAELERRALDLSGRPCAAFARSASEDGPRVLARADALDTARQLTRWADQVLREAALGRLRLSLEELGPSGLNASDLLQKEVRTTPALARLLSSRVGRVRGLLAKAQDAPEDLPAPERWVFSAHARRTERFCRRLELRGFKPLPVRPV